MRLIAAMHHALTGHATLTINAIVQGDPAIRHVDREAMDAPMSVVMAGARRVMIDVTTVRALADQAACATG